MKGIELESELESTTMEIERLKENNIKQNLCDQKIIEELRDTIQVSFFYIYLFYFTIINYDALNM